MTKEQARAVIEQMPEEFTLDQVTERLKFIEEVDKARQSYREGRFKTVDQVKAKIEAWSK